MNHKHTIRRGHSIVLRLMAASVMVFAGLGLAIAAGFATSSAFAQGNSPAAECGVGTYYWKFDNWNGANYGDIEKNTPDDIVVTINITDSKNFTWSSNSPVVRMVVKAGNDESKGSNTQNFNPAILEGSGGSTGKADISHVTFCFEGQPPTVIPEAPMAIIFPVVALIVAGGAWFVWRRQQLNAA